MNVVDVGREPEVTTIIENTGYDVVQGTGSVHLGSSGRASSFSSSVIAGADYFIAYYRDGNRGCSIIGINTSVIIIEGHGRGYGTEAGGGATTTSRSINSTSISFSDVYPSEHDIFFLYAFVDKSTRSLGGGIRATYISSTYHANSLRVRR